MNNKGSNTITCNTRVFPSSAWQTGRCSWMRSCFHVMEISNVEFRGPARTDEKKTIVLAFNPG